MIGYVQIILAFLKVVDWAVSYAHERSLISEGEDRQILKQTLEVQKRLKSFQAIEARNANLTIDQLRKEMEGEFRD